LASQLDFARAGAEQARGELYQRRLAAARRPQHGDELARPYVQVDGAQRVDIAPAGGVDQLHAVQVQVQAHAAASRRKRSTAVQALRLACALARAVPPPLSTSPATGCGLAISVAGWCGRPMAWPAPSQRTCSTAH